MSIETHAWEVPLLALALDTPPVHSAMAVKFEPSLLSTAYEYCESLTSVHSRSFYLASALLPTEQKRAARALYAFCRISDDIVDTPGDDNEAMLNAWRQRVSTTNVPHDDLVAVAWTDVRIRWDIPGRYAEQLLDGVAADLVKTRYSTFNELARYGYGVASTVGLMAMHIIGYDGNEAVPYAVRLGVALQLTNILRDVAEDWERGRIYLPQDEMAAFGLGEEDIDRGVVSERWRSFMRFQVERNRRLYAEAMPGIALLDRSGRLAITAAAEFYRGILDDIEAHDFDVFSRRAHVGGMGKIRRLPGIWWRSRRIPKPAVGDMAMGRLHASASS